MRRTVLAASVAVLTGVAAMIWTVGGLGVASAAQGHQSRGDGHDGDRDGALILRAAVAPSVPTDAAIFGVPPGGAPWQIARGQVRLEAGGKLEVRVTGLVLVTTGTNPLPDLAASVFCNGTMAATTAPAPFSPAGNSRIRATVSLPAFCPAPAVLLNPATGSAPTNVLPIYIGFDGTA
jgi:hypothetical protein